MKGGVEAIQPGAQRFWVARVQFGRGIEGVGAGRLNADESLSEGRGWRGEWVMESGDTSPA